MKLDQENILATCQGTVAPGVPDAPYRLKTKEECDQCYYDDYDKGWACSTCYKCCTCEICDAFRGYRDIFVCQECGCRVWFTGCTPYLCICVEDCYCPRCCLDTWDGPNVGPRELLTIGHSRARAWGGRVVHDASYEKVNPHLDTIQDARILITDLQEFTKKKKRSHVVKIGNTTIIYNTDWLGRILEGLEELTKDITKQADGERNV